MYDVRDIANFILEKTDLRGVKVSNLALQKLLYFAHGWFYSIYDKPLIKNKFEAWRFGPVQRVLYDQFKDFGSLPIQGRRAKFIDPLTGEGVFRPPLIDKSHTDLIDLILEKYARFTANQLVRMSHVEDGPWEQVWKQAEDAIYPGMKIPDELIYRHFKSLGPIFTLH